MYMHTQRDGRITLERGTPKCVVDQKDRFNRGHPSPRPASFNLLPKAQAQVHKNHPAY